MVMETTKQLLSSWPKRALLARETEAPFGAGPSYTRGAVRKRVLPCLILCCASRFRARFIGR
jgi:hypothetical protein